MKYKTTQKAIKNGYHYVIRVGYCNLAYLLSCEYAEAYTTRAEGWASDIYGFGNVAISTGYAAFGDIKTDYATTKKWNDKAREAVEGVIDYQEKKTILRGLIDGFIDEVIKGR